MKPSTPAELIKTLTAWHRGAMALHAVYVVLGIVATIIALLVASFTKELGDCGTKVWALVAAASAGIITAFDVGGKGNAMRKAWRNLNAALIRYREDPAFTLEQLLGVYTAAEQGIGEVTFSQLQKIVPGLELQKHPAPKAPAPARRGAGS